MERNDAAWKKMLNNGATDVTRSSDNQPSAAKPIVPKCKKRGRNTLSDFLLNKRRVSSSAAISCKRLNRRTSLYDEETRRVTLPVAVAQSGPSSSSTLWSAASSSYENAGDILYQALSIDQDLNTTIIEPSTSTSSSCRVQLNLIPALSSSDDDEEEEEDAVNQSEQFCLGRGATALMGPADKGRRASEPIVHYNWSTSFNGTKRVTNENNLLTTASARLISSGQCRRGSLPMTEKELQVLESAAHKSRHSSGAGSNHGSFVFRAAVGV
uniref:Uncharacterized protein n=1 Tax=Romanomermis culicivorax TaxID=13658 RepID=A0A915KKT5_ROMCU